LKLSIHWKRRNDNRKRFYEDLRQCPYIPFEPEYDDWCRKDKERLAKVDKQRETLLMHANQYLSHEDHNVRDMAIFVVGILGNG